ncbi:glycoside hydrolase family 78 protein [Horticoccus luteus]|uniref:alpha-L-rhamnosidase n=1 Tax=Horticoccus luteus TaxID=2862869 RepID=A0A8F9TYV6_9BACT|nr:alpha-L-rhamnosidase [Horticoccus luteus]QYM80675.1 glycoside hydrolase family 78 protein [Horticoccus luteus]
MKSSPLTRVVGLRCNHLDNPLGVHDAAPRLSWRLETGARRGARQTAYRITVSTTRTGEADLWDSGRVASDLTLNIAYAGRALASRERAWWRVTVWDEANRASESKPAFWEAGLLTAADWSAQWIGSAAVGGPETSVPSPHVRTVFNVSKKVSAARLYVTALGLYEFHLNGQRIGEDVFTPGWTDYNKRVQYQVYDVTPALRSGVNAAGAILGDGWYCGHIGWKTRQYYGDRPRLLAQLEIAYADGSRETIVSNAAWRTAPGPITESDFMHGESYDARREITGWDTADYDERGWLPVETFAAPAIELAPVLGPAVRATQELKPIAAPKLMQTWPSPSWIFDLGQNMVGRVRLHVKGTAGQMIKLRFAEMLTAEGLLYTDNLRTARQTDFYICRGDPAGETWESRFTFHGFRFVEMSGHEAEPLADAITGVVLHSDTPSTGDFTCSDALVNQLQRNIDWGQRGNFLEVPTDCPQRNERLGWMGDAQVFSRTAAWNRDVEAFFHKWMRDVEDAQTAEGAFSAISPQVEGCPPDGGPAWADAGVVSPWTMYLYYADTAILAQHYEAMKRFIGYLEKTSQNLIRVHPDVTKWGGFGDWLALDGSGKTEGGTPKDLIGTAFFAYSTDIVARTARVLGHKAEAERYERLRDRVRRAFQHRFITGDGLVSGLTQTCYVLALHFDLAPEELRPKLLAELLRDVEQRGWKLSTGFVSTSYVPHVLTRFGRSDVAYKLLHQKAWPSWLYAVTQGATTIWERWDGWTKEKGFQDPGMNSFNHYAYGAIGAWLYATVAGVDIDEAHPGYKHIVLRPTPGGELTSATGTLDSVHGRIRSAWKTAAGKFEWEVIVPPNTTASARFPVPATARLTEGGRPLARATGVKHVKASTDAVTCELAPGHYRFAATWKA